MAPGHPLVAELRFLGGGVATQHAGHMAVPLARPLALAGTDGLLLLTRALLRDDPGFAVLLDWFLAHVPVADAPPEARAACDRLANRNSRNAWHWRGTHSTWPRPRPAWRGPVCRGSATALP